MTTKQAAELYARAGRVPPPSIAAPAPEFVRNTRRKVIDGIEFRSTLEADAYQIIKSWRDAGAIRNLELQPKFVLQSAFRRGAPVDGENVRAIKYTADFQFERAVIGEAVEWQMTVIEAKGHRTQPYELRRRMFLAKFPHMRYEIWDREKIRSLSR